MAKKRVTKASEIFFQRYYKGCSKEQLEELRQTMADLALGDKIRTLRERGGLTQAQLARQIGTQPSHISRIEDADYESHSVETLRRIARALHATLRIDFVPDPRNKSDLQPA